MPRSARPPVTMLMTAAMSPPDWSPSRPRERRVDATPPDFSS